MIKQGERRAGLIVHGYDLFDVADTDATVAEAPKIEGIVRQVGVLCIEKSVAREDRSTVEHGLVAHVVLEQLQFAELAVIHPSGVPKLNVAIDDVGVMLKL
jgi:hypothetical protein